MFKKYRILEVSGVFIPQVREGLFDPYEGIDLEYKNTWIELRNQIRYSGKNSLEKAREVINVYSKKGIIHKY
jgi:hypothetical protein